MSQVYKDQHALTGWLLWQRRSHTSLTSGYYPAAKPAGKESCRMNISLILPSAADVTAHVEANGGLARTTAHQVTQSDYTSLLVS